MIPTRRGVERCKEDELGPTGLVRKPPPSGGGGGGVLLHRAVVCPASVFGHLWGPVENF